MASADAMEIRKRIKNRDDKVRVIDWSNPAWLRHIVRTSAKLNIDMSTEDESLRSLTSDEIRDLHEELNVKGRIGVGALRTGMRSHKADLEIWFDKLGGGSLRSDVWRERDEKELLSLLHSSTVAAEDQRGSRVGHDIISEVEEGAAPDHAASSSTRISVTKRKRVVSDVSI